MSKTAGVLTAKLGELGEKTAVRLFKARNCTILARNWRNSSAHDGAGELDIVLLDGETLVFAEVKYRPAGQMGQGASAVDMQKKKNLRYAARHYLSRHTHAFFRFDVVEITAAGIRHIPNAF